MSRRAIAMVELMVVIAIICIFAGLIIPVITKAKRNHDAKKVQAEAPAVKTVKVTVGYGGESFVYRHIPCGTIERGVMHLKFTWEGKAVEIYGPVIIEEE